MKALFVGLGGIGQRHLRNLRSILGAEVSILAYRVRRLSHLVTPTLQADNSRDVETEHAITVFDNLEAALKERPSVAFICNPSGLHIAAASACIKAGCDVFLEKPVSDSLHGCEELLGLVKQSERIVMVGYQLRFHPCFLKLQQIVQSGVLGKVLAVRSTVGEYLPGWHPYEDYRQMYAARADLGGGVLVTQIHEFDYLYALFGLPKRIFAVGGHLSHLEIDVEDVSSTLMEYHIEGRRFPVHLHQDYLQRPASRNCEVVCDQGKLLMDLVSLTVTAYDSTGKVLSVDKWEGFDRNQLFLDELSHFLESVQTRRKPLVDLSDGLSSLAMALAARKSILSGQAVAVKNV